MLEVEDQLQAARLRRLLPSPAERRLLRVSRGVTLGAIAARCGVSAVTALRWEQGTRMPKGQHLSRYIETLGLLRK